MKRECLEIFAAVQSVALLCSCAPNLVPDSSDLGASDFSENAFELFASAPDPFARLSGKAGPTKTVLNGDWSVSWCPTDRMSVFNRGVGENAYSPNCRFLISDVASGRFVKDVSETSKDLVSGKAAYDWYACSPWMQYGAAPSGTKGYTVPLSPMQVGYGSSSHVSEADILAGKALNVLSGDAPEMEMNHVCTLMKFTVVNGSPSPVAIASLKLDASAGASYIAGSFTMDWGADASTLPRLDPARMGSSKSYSCTLNVVENAGTDSEPEYVPMTEEIGVGESADFYMVTAPFRIPAGGKVKLEISGSGGICSLEKTMSRETSFLAGTFNTAAIVYSNPEKILFMEDFGTKAVATAKVPAYDKTGLYVLYPEDKAGYGYGVYNNASLQTADYSGKTASGAYVRFPKQNASMTVTGVALHGNTKLKFSYRKDSGNGCVTALKWRFNGTSSWTVLQESSETGIVSCEFEISNPDGKAIDIQIQNLSAVTAPDYPTVDDWKLVALP